MPSLFSRLKGLNTPTKIKTKSPQTPNFEPTPKPVWKDAWARNSVEPEEVQELLHGCLLEVKARGLDTPFVLLPYRPTSDPSAARTFIRNYFDRKLRGDELTQELRLTEPMALCSVMKWCWSRISGGVVGWEVYELFRVGESDSNMARYSFATFVPLSVDSEARSKIIFDFFDLLSAIAAHSKTNGLGGRKLSRLAGWWAFDQTEDGNGFEGGYSKWISAADATSHLFFAYLRSLSQDSGKGLSGISRLPVSLQQLLQETDYPPKPLKGMQSKTPRVLMIVETVSPTPFALLRRANHFQYRDEDKALMEFAEYIDPVETLTDECKRVLTLISSANQSQAISSKSLEGPTDICWSRFEDLGFSDGFDEKKEEEEVVSFVKRYPHISERTNMAKNPVGRPTTPSWAEFLSSGFVDELKNVPSPLILPPDLSLPPIEVRSHSSHSPSLNRDESQLEPGELASIAKFHLDDAFWWVWISSLAAEESSERKAAFGRCALVETILSNGRWLLIEEKVKGAAIPPPEEGAYIAEKKRFWGRSKKNKGSSRRKSIGKPIAHISNVPSVQSPSQTKISPSSDPHARIQAAAAKLQEKQNLEGPDFISKIGRSDDAVSMKTSSVFTLQPMIVSEASPAMKWANKYDKDTIRASYLANVNSGRGFSDSPSTSEHPLSPNTIGTLRNDSHSISSSLSSPHNVHTNESPQNSERVSTTPHSTKFPKISTSEVKLDSQESPLEPEQPPHQKSPEPISEDKLHAEHEALINGDSQVRTNSKKGGGLKRLFGRNKSHNSKGTDHARPPQVTNGREAVERKKKPSSVSRSLSGFRKRSLSLSGKRNSIIISTPPVDAITSDESKINSSHPPDQSSARTISPVDDMSRVSTNEAQEAQKAFSSFDQGLVEDIPAATSEKRRINSEKDDESHVSPILEQQKSNSRSSFTEEQDLPNKDTLEEMTSDQSEKERKSEDETALVTSAEDEMIDAEESIEYRVARIKARVAQLTGNTEGGAAETPSTPPKP